MSVPENATNNLEVPVSNPSDSVVAPAAVVLEPVVASDVAPVVVPVVAPTNVVISENNLDSNKVLVIDFSNNKYLDLLGNEDVKSAVTLLLNHVNAVENIVNTFKSLYPIDIKDIPIIVHVLNKTLNGFNKEKELIDKLTPVLFLHIVKAVLVILIKENKIVVDNPDTVVNDIKNVIDGLVSIEELVVKVKSCSCVSSSCWAYKSSKCCN